MEISVQPPSIWVESAEAAEMDDDDGEVGEAGDSEHATALSNEMMTNDDDSNSGSSYGQL